MIMGYLDKFNKSILMEESRQEWHQNLNILQNPKNNSNQGITLDQYQTKLPWIKLFQQNHTLHIYRILKLEKVKDQVAVKHSKHWCLHRVIHLLLKMKIKMKYLLCLSSEIISELLNSSQKFWYFYCFWAFVFRIFNKLKEIDNTLR